MLKSDGQLRIKKIQLQRIACYCVIFGADPSDREPNVDHDANIPSARDDDGDTHILET